MVVDVAESVVNGATAGEVAGIAVQNPALGVALAGGAISGLLTSDPADTYNRNPATGGSDRSCSLRFRFN
jgi:hypothetical protein